MKNERKQVSIISRESNEKTLDVLMLEEELLKRGIKVRTLSRLLTKERSLKALGYAGHILKQEAAILCSDVVILDTYCIPASMLPHRIGTAVIQMWHALGAIKKFGWQTVGREGGSSERTARIMKMHRGYDYIVSPSDITAEHFCEAFKADSGKVVKYGLPRIDYIKSVSAGDRREEMRKKLLSAYPELRAEGRSTVLYAPTFRRGSAVDADGLINALDPEKHNVVVKLHPLYRAPGQETSVRQPDGSRQADNGRGEENWSRCVIYDEAFSSYDWLSVCDIVISDYSSFVIEASLADKPMFIYAYDLEEYAENTGLNIDFGREPIAPYVFRDAGELADAIDAACGCADSVKNADSSYDLEALRAFRDRYIDIDTENCTAALADFIESLL